MDGSQLTLFEGDGELRYHPWRIDRATRERGLQGVAQVRRVLKEAQERREGRSPAPTTHNPPKAA